MEDKCTGKVLVYLDNSNIFINAQEFSARKYGLLVPQDPRCRVDMGKLFSFAQNGRIVLQARLYGSEPPALDTVWDSIRKKQIEVSVSPRSIWNDREKQIDTNLTADAVEDIINYKEYASHKNSAVIIFSGDKDMVSTVRKAKHYKWNVEIWSFRKSICNDFVADKGIKTFYIDDDEFFDNISFYATVHRGRIPRERSFVICFNGLCKALGKGFQFAKVKDELSNLIVRKATELFLLPMMIQVNETDIIVIVACVQKRFDMVLYDFTKHVWNKKDTLVEYIEDELLLSNITFMTYVQYIQANEHYINILEDQNFPNDDEFPVEHPDYPVDTTFTTVVRKVKRTNQRFSSSCSYGYRCSNANKCKHSHTDKEKEYFKVEQSPAKRFNYKTKLCYLSNCKFRNRTHLCSFAHSLQEARCAKCQDIGLHWTDECKENRQ